MVLSHQSPRFSFETRSTIIGEAAAMPLTLGDHPLGEDAFRPPDRGGAPDESHGYITRSLNDAYNVVLRRLRLYAPHAFPIVLEGESGTGKSLLARQVHRWSARSDRPFEVQSLANLSDSLAESELFGHAKGAFTGAIEERKGNLRQAHSGTLFLDEVGHASLQVQAKLLEITEVGRVRPLGSDRIIPIDVRLLFASSEPTQELAASGRMLPDLYARLRTWRVRVPSLSERVEDIPILVEQCLEKNARRMDLKRIPHMSAEAMGVLCRAEWPGNIRQLDQAIAALIIHVDGGRRITKEHFFGDELTEVLESSKRKRKRVPPEEVRRVYQKMGNVKRAAVALGVCKNTVRAHRKAGEAAADSEVALESARDWLIAPAVSGDRVIV